MNERKKSNCQIHLVAYTVKVWLHIQKAAIQFRIVTVYSCYFMYYMNTVRKSGGSANNDRYTDSYLRIIGTTR